VRRLAVVLVCGCGRIGFEATSDGATSTVDADTSCWPLWRAGTVAFTAPSVITELASTAGETNPYLASDGRHLYFNRGLGGMRDIFMAVRPSPAQAFAPAVPLSVLNSTADEGRLAIKGAGHIGYFASIRPGVGNFDLYSVITDDGETFTPPSMMSLANINTSAFEGSPEISDDASRLYFTYGFNVMPSRIHVSEWDGVQAYLPAVPVAGLDQASQLSDFAVSPDELVALFTITTTRTDLHYATRTSVTAPFGPATPIAELNTTGANDDDPTWSYDGCEMIFSSDRVANAELYRATVVR
jgi:WD40-like Beta Propeller Repeat